MFHISLYYLIKEFTFASDYYIIIIYTVIFAGI